MHSASLSVVLALLTLHCAAGPIVRSFVHPTIRTDVLTIIPVTPTVTSLLTTPGSTTPAQRSSQESQSAHQSVPAERSSLAVQSGAHDCTCTAARSPPANVTTHTRGMPQGSHPLSSPRSHLRGQPPTSNTACPVVTPPSKNTQRNGFSDTSGAADTPSDGVSAHSPESTHAPGADPIMVVVDRLPSATATLTLYGGPHPLVPHMTWRPTVTTTLGVTGNGNALPTSGVDVSLEARNLHAPSPDELPILDIVNPLLFTTETITLYGGYNPLQPHLTTTPTMTTTLGVPAAPPAPNTNLPPALPAVQTDQPPPVANIPATPGTQPPPPPGSHEYHGEPFS